MKENLKLGWSQDQHLFAPRLGVDRPLEALRSIFGDDDYTGELDGLFYGGDLFDFYLDKPATDERIQKVLAYMGWRLEQSVKHDYAVRVLKGTPSHDREQNQMWNTVNDILGNKADFKYIDTLCIENHPVLGDILYIPDEWKPTADEVWLDVVEALRAKSLTKVHWIIMHGAFKFQLPEHLHSKITFLHDEARYSAICSKHILVGHVHIKGQYKNITSIGSLDRKTFGEEAAKGALRIHCSPVGDDMIFIENTLARTMPTIDIKDLTFDEVITKVSKIIESCDPSYLSIRFVGSKLDEVYINLASISKRFEGVEFVFKDSEAKAKLNPMVKIDQSELIVHDVDLSIKNVTDMLKDRIGSKMNDSIDIKIESLFKGYS